MISGTNSQLSEMTSNRWNMVASKENGKLRMYPRSLNLFQNPTSNGVN